MAGMRRGLFGYQAPTEEERKRALEHPGPTWREFFFYDFMKVWLVLGFLIVDVWAVGAFAQPFNPAAMLLSLVALLYGEFLLYRFLWYRPGDSEATRSARRAGFRPTWSRPVAFGRWTPEADRARSGRDPYEGYVRGPDPREFL